MPVKHFDMQADMKMHLSQSTGTGAFDGQHGISLAISSVVADRDISSAIACIEPWEGAPAMTGWETGANARPAIIKTASSRRMATLRFTRFNLVRLASIRDRKPHVFLPETPSSKYSCEPRCRQVKLRTRR
jgi:hypothetical protein